MGEMRDFKCTYGNSAGINEEVTKGLGLQFPDVHMHCDTMVQLSKALKKHDGASFCLLPFCHTVEAEALGGSINYGNDITGPRAKDYICSTVEEVLELPEIDLTKGRIHEVLLACQELRQQGEHVILEVSGPFTILNVLIDATYVFKGMRKKPEVMKKVFWKLGTEILKFIEEAKKYGVDMISYADSSGGLNILGPKMSEQVVEEFTYDFLIKVEEKVDNQMLVLLCPKTTYALIGTEKAVFKERQLSQPMSYGEGCIEMIGKARFAGQMCINNVGYQLKNGKFKEVKLNEN
ncbi:MAG: uroporphyrinogen decarboxylase family protein [Lachnospiraceae bacterium]